MKQIKQIVAIIVLLAAAKCTKFVFGRGSAPDPAAWGSSRRSPDPLVGWGGGHPLPIPLPRGASLVLGLGFGPVLR